MENQTEMKMDNEMDIGIISCMIIGFGCFSYGLGNLLVKGLLSRVRTGLLGDP